MPLYLNICLKDLHSELLITSLW